MQELELEACVRTALTGKTTSALFILDAMAPIFKEDVEVAGDDLITALEQGS